MKKACLHTTPLGPVAIVENGEFLTNLLFAETLPADTEEATSPLLEETVRQLDEYFAGRRTAFDLPLAPEGTPYQRLIWRTLQDIPYGETASYAEIAARTGNPQASRAVGGANHRNPLPILIPCHRVIGTNGKLTGYAGGLARKEFLLGLERRDRGE